MPAQFEGREGPAQGRLIAPAPMGQRVVAVRYYEPNAMREMPSLRVGPSDGNQLVATKVGVSS